MVTDPLVARLPADALVLLVGPSGSGKSTWAVSLGSSRARCSRLTRCAIGSLAMPRTSRPVPTPSRRSTSSHALAYIRGLLTVVDATNLSRRELVAHYDWYRREGPDGRRWRSRSTSALERCLAQNEARPDRAVPDHVIRRHRQEMTTALKELPAEGYVEVHVVRDSEIGSG